MTRKKDICSHLILRALISSCLFSHLSVAETEHSASLHSLPTERTEKTGGLHGYSETRLFCRNDCPLDRWTHRRADSGIPSAELHRHAGPGSADDHGGWRTLPQTQQPRFPLQQNLVGHLCFGEFCGGFGIFKPLLNFFNVGNQHVSLENEYLNQTIEQSF